MRKRKINHLLGFILLLGSSVQMRAQSPGDTIGIDTCQLMAPCSPIQADTTTGEWEVGNTTKPYFTNFGTDTIYGAMTDSTLPYDTLMDHYFQLSFPVGDLNDTWYGNLILSFDHIYETDSAIDGGYIEVSHDGGNNWTELSKDDSAISLDTAGLYKSNDSIMDGKIGYSDSSGGFRTVEVKWTWYYPVLPPKGGSQPASSVPDSTKLRFHFISDSGQTNKDGWLIRNFRLSSIYWTSIRSFKEEEPAELFPNPMETQTTFKFEAEKGSSSKFFLYNEEGQRVRHRKGIKNGRFTLKRKSLEAGVYLYRIHTEGKAYKGRLVVAPIGR